MRLGCCSFNSARTGDNLGLPVLLTIASTTLGLLKDVHRKDLESFPHVPENLHESLRPTHLLSGDDGTTCCPSTVCPLNLP